jgi:hypothetical protein
MRKWEATARAFCELDRTAPQPDGVTAAELAARAGTLRIYGALDVLEDSGLAKGSWEELGSSRGDNDPRRRYRLTPKAEDIDAVLAALFGAATRAPGMPTAIVYALRTALDGPGDGWMSGRRLAKIVRASLEDGSARRAVWRLIEIGLVERRGRPVPSRS